MNYDQHASHASRWNLKMEDIDKVMGWEEVTSLAQ